MGVALAIVILLVVGGAGLFLAGLYMLAGVPWMLLVAGSAFIAAGLFLRAGLNPGG